MPVPFPHSRPAVVVQWQARHHIHRHEHACPDPLCRFHPAVAGWFSAAFPPRHRLRQQRPLVRAGRSTLVAAPTGSGKTLTAFRRHRRAGAAGPDRGRAGRRHPGALRVAAQGAVQRYPYQPRTTAGRHRRRAATARPAAGGHSHRCAHRRHAAGRAQRDAQAGAAYPVTTPESLYVLLGSESGGRCCAMCAA